MTKSFSDITDADREKVIQMYKDANVIPETNHQTIQAIIKATDIYEHAIKRILKEADIYVPSPTPEYQDLETATAYCDAKFNGGYTDIHFRGTIRMFGDTDAWIDGYSFDDEFLSPGKRHLGETLAEYQVRMELLTRLDFDCQEDSEDKFPYYRPFDVETSERDIR